VREDCGLSPVRFTRINRLAPRPRLCRGDNYSGRRAPLLEPFLAATQRDPQMIHSFEFHEIRHISSCRFGIDRGFFCIPAS
jgi:hypothetical protein